MYEDVDLTQLHEVEQMQRSIAMLPPRAEKALNREEALRVLDALLAEYNAWA